MNSKIIKTVFLVLTIGTSVLFQTVTSAACNTSSSSSSLRPSNGDRFDKVLNSSLRLQFPTTGTCISNISGTNNKYIPNRWYRSGNNLIFNFPNANNGQRMELRGKSFSAKTSGTGRQTWEARVSIDTNGADRYTIGQLFADGDDDAAKLQFHENRSGKRDGLWLTYAPNRRDSDKFIYLGKMDGQENIRMRYYRGSGRFTVEFNGSMKADVRLDGYHNARGQQMYWKAGVYFQTSGNGRATFNKLNF